MPDRLLIQESGGVPTFKVSRPGFDVNTANESQLLFDMNGVSSYVGQYIRGSVSNTWTTGNTTVAANGERSGSFSTTISLGKTFASPPVVFCRMLRGGISYPPYYWRWPYGYLTYTNGARYIFMANFFYMVTTTTDLTIYRGGVQGSWQAGGGSGPIQSASYSPSEDPRLITLTTETYEYIVAQN